MMEKEKIMNKETIMDKEDYRKEDGLLYCGVCHEPKEEYFPDRVNTWRETVFQECVHVKEKNMRCYKKEKKSLNMNVC